MNMSPSLALARTDSVMTKTIVAQSTTLSRTANVAITETRAMGANRIVAGMRVRRILVRACVRWESKKAMSALRVRLPRMS